jgi:hypothetical protein
VSAKTATATATTVKRRRLAIRLGLVALWFILIVLLFVNGKGHVLILDNQPMPGVTPLAEGFSVSVDGRKPVSFSFGLDRDMAKVQGQSHRITVTGLPGGQTVSKDIAIKLDDEMAILSIPKLVAGVEPAVATFVPKTAAPSPEPEAASSPAAGSEAALPDGGLLPAVLPVP